MSAPEVATPTCVLNIIGGTQSIKDSHIGSNTRKNYTYSLAKFMLSVFESHMWLVFHQEVLQHNNYMDMECPPANYKENNKQFQKNCVDFLSAITRTKRNPPIRSEGKDVVLGYYHIA